MFKMSDDDMNEFLECAICMTSFDTTLHVPRLLQCIIIYSFKIPFICDYSNFRST